LDLLPRTVASVRRVDSEIFFTFFCTLPMTEIDRRMLGGKSSSIGLFYLAVSR